ncbi:mechanosensitive ion channel [Candidatus Termititenax persephonae]|uniref:Mechanosensitive ion channel n=1 Tax=Candidatus Termititenax persephonae TaxID=2218525 RepID=A0A388TJI1_9BACT|nr:mechanosensitive ion channel [Candidatus Termititenax persephonae]
MLAVITRFQYYGELFAGYFKFAYALLALIVVYYAVRYGINLLLPFVERALDKRPGHNHKQTVAIIKITMQTCIWIIVLIILLDNLGLKISALVTGLGISGIAIALAAQSILGDLFSYFIIFFDRPFELGDYIVIDEFKGTVENIGIKTTRLRSLSGEELIFSNTDLTGARVRNYKRMNLRRISFRLNVSYQTPSELLQAIPQILTKIIQSVKQTSFDRAHFAEYGDSTLIFEVVYYVLSSDYNKYMDTQQEINFKIKTEFAQHGIDFAYPTQTVVVKS